MPMTPRERVLDRFPAWVYERNGRRPAHAPFIDDWGGGHPHTFDIRDPDVSVASRAGVEYVAPG